MILTEELFEGLARHIDKVCAAEWEALTETLNGKDIPPVTHRLVNAVMQAAFALGFETAKDPSWLIYEDSCSPGR